MLSFIGNQFRKPTGFFGKVLSKIMAKGNSPVYDKIIPALAIEKNDRILEIGYGHGIGINRIASSCDCTVTGIDFSELMFREAAKRNKKHIANKKVELLHGDFLSFDIGSNKFDTVFCINVIYFWENLNEPFSKIYEGLKDGGLFSFYMVHRDDLGKLKFTKDGIFNKYSIDQVVDCLELCGFTEINCKLDNGYFIKCKKVNDD